MKNKMSKYPCVVVNIYENGSYPVVAHVFYGKTLSEARGYFRSHMRTDEFMRDAINHGEWNGIPLKVEMFEHGGC